MRIQTCLAIVLCARSPGPSRACSSVTTTFKVALRGYGYLGQGSAEEPGILQRHDQGCVDVSLGSTDPILPLSAPTGVQLAPRSLKLVEGELCVLPLYGVLRSSPKTCR